MMQCRICRVRPFRARSVAGRPRGAAPLLGAVGLLIGSVCASGCAHPLIESLVIEPGGSARTCEELTLKVRVGSPTHGNLVYSWAVVNAPEGAVFKLVTAGPVAWFTAATPSFYRVSVSVTDDDRRRDSSPALVRIDEGDDSRCLAGEPIESWGSRLRRRSACRL